MRTAAIVLLLGAVVAAQSAVNVSGKWAIQPAGRGAAPRGGGAGGGGRGGQTLTLNQVGSTLTGELVGGGGGGGGSAAPINNEIVDGKVDGAKVSFYIWRGTDKPYKVSYAGTVSAAGDEIAFTVTGAPARAGGPGGAGAGAGATPAAPPPTIAKRVQ